MTNRWLKLLSIFLSLVLIFNLLPLQVLASNIDDTPPLQLSTLPEDGSSGSITGYQRLDTATVVEEDASRRGEYHKEFVLNNGLRHPYSLWSIVAVMKAVAVCPEGKEL